MNSQNKVSTVYHFAVGEYEVAVVTHDYERWTVRCRDNTNAVSEITHETLTKAIRDAWHRTNAMVVPVLRRIANLETAELGSPHEILIAGAGGQLGFDALLRPDDAETIRAITASAKSFEINVNDATHSQPTPNLAEALLRTREPVEQVAGIDARRLLDHAILTSDGISDADRQMIARYVSGEIRQGNDLVH